jgi:hypothetical protein
LLLAAEAEAPEMRVEAPKQGRAAPAMRVSQVANLKARGMG